MVEDLKMKFVYCVILLVTFLSYWDSTWAYFINYRRPCRDLSPECLKECLQAAVIPFANGDTALGLQSLDPYYFSQLNMTLSEGISMDVSEGVAKGFKSCVVDFARLQGDTLESQMHCNLIIRGKYKSFGQLMMFPVDQEGDSTIYCRNIRLNSNLKFGTTLKADGHRYLQIIKSDITTSYDGRVSFSMTDLYRGNPEISRMLLNFMNSNWRMVAEDFGGPMVDFGIRAVMNNVRRLLDVLPIDALERL